MVDWKKIRADFPVLQKNEVIYFDNACTTLKPQKMIDAVCGYYENYSACAGRSIHRLSNRTDEACAKARETVGKFVNAKSDEVVWTKNTTEAINLVAHALDFSERKKVVMSNLEHHAALLPFQRLATLGKIKLEFVHADADGFVNAEEWKKRIDSQTALVVTHHTTNTTGIKSPFAEIIKMAHDAGAMVLIDGAQGAPHSKIDFKKSDFDFFAFSAHKMCGPTGIGALVGKYDELEVLSPFMMGGETIESTTLTSMKMLPPPKKFEAGIQNYAGIIGFGAACEYLMGIGMENVEKREHELAKKLYETLLANKKVKAYGTHDWQKRGALAMFNIGNVDPNQAAVMLDSMEKIAVRSGLFCAHPAMEHFGVPKGAVRASLYIYNNEEEIEKLGKALEKIAELG
jgi:cysteine desulfurase/selenocysteine lyase